MSTEKFSIGKSNIHGNGIIATAQIKKGEIIGVAIINAITIPHITENLGIYINHCYQCNARLVFYHDQYNLIAMRDIQPDEEITADYNFNPSFLSKAKHGYI